MERAGGGAVIECTACGAENPEGAGFCARCGNALGQTCPVCSFRAPADARFCSNCGNALRAATDTASPTPSPTVTSGSVTPPRTLPAATMPAEEDLRRYVPEALLTRIRAAGQIGAMRGERRTVTMLFADLVGSTAAAERLDPEEWADIVNGAFEHLIAPVYRYEGTLARLQGDAILAFFGAPLAHEDDPVRAVHAGLEMLRAIEGYAAEVERRTGVPVAVRVGINTGLVVVGEVGSDLRVEYTALGDAINLAARMEQTAEPGTVRITQDTARLLGDRFVTTEIGEVEARGRAEPVVAFRVEAVAPAEDHAPTTPLLGRDRELATLREVLDRLDDGLGSIVTLVGEAGLGKSRLLASLRDELRARTVVAEVSGDDGEVAWLEGQCRSFDRDVPYAPFRDVAIRWLPLQAVEPTEVFDRIAAAVERVHGAPDLDAASYLTHVTGAPLPEPQARLLDAIDTAPLHARATAALVDYFEAEAFRRPLVLVIDDLHWADALSLALVEQLIRVVERAPIALLVALRPVHDEPAWRLVEVAAREAAHRHTALHLGPLDEPTTDVLLQELLGDEDLSPERRRALRERADGNPLFLEELVGSLEGSGTVVLPASLTGLLTARLDRLEQRTRVVAEVAAVVGQEFDLDSLTELLDDEVEACVAELVRAGVVVERRRRPRPAFAFRHALLHEAAYETILLKERRNLHGRLARYLAAVEPDAPYEVARHHLASDRPDAAFPWLVQAGERSTRVMAISEAIRAFSTALDHLPADPDPDLVARAHLGLGEAYSLVPDLDSAAAAYQTLVEYGQAAERPPLQVKALNQLGMNAAVLAADFATANQYLAEARGIATEAGDELGLAECHLNSCFVAAAEGNLDRAIEHDLEVFRIGTEAGADDLRLAGLMRRALNQISRADVEDELAGLHEARAEAEAVGAEDVIALLDGEGEALVRQRNGDLDGALALIRSAGDTLTRYDVFQAPFVHHHGARVALLLGRTAEAVAMLDAARRTMEGQSAVFARATIEATAAEVHAGRGDAAASQRHRELALAGLSLPLGDFQASTVWADLTSASILLGRWDDAEADSTLGLEASSATRFWERPRLLASAARVALHRGATDRASDLLDEAQAYVEERRMRLFLPLLATVRAGVARASGDLRRAEAELVAADELAHAMGMRPLEREIAGSLAEVVTAMGRSREAAEHRRREAALTAEMSAEMSAEMTAAPTEPARIEVTDVESDAAGGR
jgi:class 3 adenylate cyclase/tetratricopeptide (TPR) repeat protein